MSDFQHTPSDGGDDSRLRQRFRLGSIILALTTIVVGAAVLLGWALDIRLLKSVFPGVVTMKANTALAFMLAGAALVLRSMPSTSTLWTRISEALAMVVVAIGGLTVLEYAANWNIGIDELLFVEDPNPTATTARGRMAPATAVSFIMLGAAILMMERQSERRKWVGDLLALIPCVLGMYSLLEYALRTPILFAPGAYTRMAVHTAVLFMVIGTGVLLARDGQVFVRLIAGGQTKAVVRWPRGVIVVSVLLLLGAGGWFYRKQEEDLRSGVERNLQAIVESKTDQIVRWRKRFMDDASVIGSSQSAINDASAWLVDPADSNAFQRLSAWLTLIRDHRQYHSALLLDADCKTRVAVAPGGAAIGEHAVELARQVLRSNRPILSDIHTNVVGIAHMDLVVPMASTAGTGGTEMVGAVLLRVDVERFLYPLISSWPLPSGSAESFLVRREGGSVLFLTPLRFRTDAMLEFRIRLGNEDISAVKAVMGYEGVWYGEDYRGTDVVAVLRRIPDSPWFMIAKMDEREAFAGWRFRAVLIAVVVAALGAILLLAGSAIRWRIREEHYRELYEAERAVRASEERYRAVLMGVGDGVIACQVDGTVQLLNPVAEALTGWKQGDACGRPLEEVFRVVEEVSRRSVDNPVRRVMQEGSVVGLENHALLISRDGVERPIADSGAPVRDNSGAVIGVVLVFRDQTSERKAEEAVKRERANLLAVMDSSPVALLVAGDQNRVVFANNAARSLCSHSSAPAGLHRCGDFLLCANRRKDGRGCGFGPECPECSLDAAVRNAILNGSVVHGKEAEFVCDSESGPSARWLRFDVGVLEFDGRRSAIVALTDVSESHRMLEQAARARLALLSILEDQKQAEERARDGEAMYRALFDEAVDGVALAERDSGRLVACNRALCRMVERDMPELAGQHQSVLHPAGTLVDGYSSSFSLHRKQDLPDVLTEDTLLSKSGRLIAVEIKAACVRMKGKEYLLSVFRDVTERHKAEEERNRLWAQLLQSQKLESIGTLASGVAHEVNNPIMGIMNYADLIMEGCDSNNPALGYAAEILKETERVAGIVKNLLSFAGQDRSSRDPARMCDIVEAMMSLVRTLLRHEDIRISVDVPRDLPAVRCSSQKIQQVLMNLVMNSRDALNDKFGMGSSGKVISVVARLIERDGRSWLRTTVEDNGQGIPEAIRSRIFDPFFTTKQPSKGTGLGLSIGHSIANEHGGMLTVESKAGVFARFHLDLPVDNG